MKALDQIEPRTPIESLPFTISESGSYYLAASLTGTPGSAGVTIAADNVTLDLNGFSLIGVPGSLDGIWVTTGFKYIRIQNGIVEDWDGNGINTAAAEHCQLTRLLVARNGADGVALGQHSSIHHSKLHQNARSGIQTLGHCVASDNICDGNQRGVNLSATNNVVENNVCLNNTSHGIRVTADNSVVQNNKTIDNGIGFEVTGRGNRIASNYTFGNGANAQANQVLTAEENHYELLISDLPETLDQPCSARLTGNLVNSVANGDGITIAHNNVTLDLGGFTLFGTGGGGTVTNPATVPHLRPYFESPINSDDGIFVFGDADHLTVRNGSVVGWGGDGINALNADFSRFENLHVGYNDGDGLVADFNCLILNCTAVANGLDGLEGDDGTVIKNCSAAENGDNGIQTSEGCSVVHCNSFDNMSDGIDVAAGSTVIGCSATDNGIFGFDIALGSTVVDCTAYDNISNGFDMASSCIMDRCHSSLNNGNGVRTFANSRITNGKFHENDLDGIRIQSTDCVVEGNTATDNDQVGINVSSSGCLIIGNRAAGNLTNYVIVTTSAFGPIVNVTGAGDIAGRANANHPQANFEF